MINPRAEESFRDGKLQLQSGRARDAVAFFKAAIDIEREGGGEADRQGRYLSYYGLALCQSRNGYREALRHCRTATSLDPERPDLWLNLGRVAMALGRRAEAYRAWQRGLSLDPESTGLLREAKRIGIRRPPVFSFLPRQHGINVALGRLRSRISASPRPADVRRGVDAEEGSVVGIQVIG